MKRIDLPKEIESLNAIAHNLWWSWTHDSWELFSMIDADHWSSNRNPAKLLQETSTKRFIELSTDKNFLNKLEVIETSFDKYMSKNDRWYQTTYPKRDKELVAYFCAEYGIHESLPIYSGGLGVLAGDHTKSSSDLGIPMVFVGLFYKNGYFTQQINNEGQQVDVYEHFDPKNLSIEEALDSNGKELIVSIELPKREVKVKVWSAKIGRNTLYLLDTNLEENTKEDRDLTARLYGGDREMRVSQEIVLGIAGVKALNAMSLKPTGWHMNEGHSGFFQLERAKDIMKETGLSFEEAKVLCASNCTFTTHTPVPAGNETFELPLMHKYFYEYIKELKISWDRFLKLGLVEEKTDYKYFSLTIFAINFSRFQNGVSELHGRIAKKMWRSQWENVPEIDNPITHITNGVHVPTWASKEMKDYFSSELGEDWINNIADQSMWNKLIDVDTNNLAITKVNLKQKMITMVRDQLKSQLKRNGETKDAIEQVDTFLKDDVLTIGFARRFATYKRATLIFKNEEKLAKIINDTDRPVQFIFAGKAHPADIPGQQFIKEIYKISRKPEFLGKVIILENYDMNISRHLISGVDVWLNNPRRPMEASGTSGQKVPLNAGLNFSVLDGWWREGYDGKNGWIIGEEKDYPSDEIQDFEDANDFYRTLNETIAPLYYKQENGHNQEWFKKSLVSLVTNIAKFSTMRMVSDYVKNLYIPAIDYGRMFHMDEFINIDKYIKTKRFIKRNWPTVAISKCDFSGDTIEVNSNFETVNLTPSHHVENPLDDTLPGRVFETVETDVNLSVYLGDLDPKDISCELVVTENNTDYHESVTLSLGAEEGQGIYKYSGKFISNDGKTKRIRVRAFPKLAQLSSKFEFGIASWL